MGNTFRSTRFYEGLCTTQAGLRGIKIWILYIDNHPAAMQFHGISGSVAYLFRSDFDEEYRNAAPGNALNTHIIQAYCEDESISEFDLCGMDYEYKKRLSTGIREHRHIEIFPNRFASQALFFMKQTRAAIGIGQGGLEKPDARVSGLAVKK